MMHEEKCCDFCRCAPNCCLCMNEKYKKAVLVTLDAASLPASRRLLLATTGWTSWLSQGRELHGRQSRRASSSPGTSRRGGDHHPPSVTSDIATTESTKAEPTPPAAVKPNPSNTLTKPVSFKLKPKQAYDHKRMNELL